MKCLDTVRPDNAVTGPKNAPSQRPPAVDTNSCEPVPHDTSPRREVVAEPVFYIGITEYSGFLVRAEPQYSLLHALFGWVVFQSPQWSSPVTLDEGVDACHIRAAGFHCKTGCPRAQAVGEPCPFYGDLRRMARVPQVGEVREVKQRQQKG